MIAIAKFDDRDLAILRSLVRTRLKINSFQSSEFVIFFMSSELKKFMAMLAALEREDFLIHHYIFFTLLQMFQ